MNQYLHFTLGPVQGFVAQARRTRDFWAGSFLLSWLTAHAMKSVIHHGGTIIMPSVANDGLLKMVLKKPVSQPPTTGSIPNNFIAHIPPKFDGKTVTEAVQTAWRTLAEAVWQHDQLAACGISKTLWDQQIEHFWDMAWVISDYSDAAVLAQRKNWRTYVPPTQYGDKCTMMGEWQEISGADCPNPKKQAKDWQTIKQRQKHALDLRDGERLCAIAYVKRRFIHGWEHLHQGQSWALPKSIPSTSYMAAVHWLEAALQYAKAEHLEAFHDAAQSLNKDYGEWSTTIRCIDEHTHSRLLYRFASLDGRLFFDSELENKKEFPNGSSQALQQALAAIKKTVLPSGDTLAAPSPFYAVLMMDGDSLGAIKRALDAQGEGIAALSTALAAFTQAVVGIVQHHHGFLVYAGGDDVLAITPVEDAMPCAAACRRAYQKAFAGKLDEQKHSATISAAIEFTHMKVPLTAVLADAHRLLDAIAKEQTGRDAIACRIWKAGGMQQTWAMPWAKALNDDHTTLIIADLANKLGAESTGDAGYANKFLYHIRATLQMLDGDSPLDADIIQSLLIADYLSSGLLDGVDDKLAAAQALIEPLLGQCRAFIDKKATGRFTADGALLLRFLAQKGVE